MYKFDLYMEAACQIGILSDIYEKHVGYKTDGFFVELGAFDGFSWSNTLPLIEAGWQGIMVEPDPENFFYLSNRHYANQKLTLVNAAISDVSMETVRLYSGGSSSTIVKDMIDIFRNTPGYGASGMSEDNFVDVVSYKMDDMLVLYHCPHKFDVLSIDVEGAEVAVLSGYDINRHRPKLVIAEGDEDHDNPLLRASARYSKEYFTSHGYMRIYYDRLNSIFLDKRR